MQYFLKDFYKVVKIKLWVLKEILSGKKYISKLRKIQFYKNCVAYKNKSV